MFIEGRVEKRIIIKGETTNLVVGLQKKIVDITTVSVKVT